jgi:hypothetical protein
MCRIMKSLVIGCLMVSLLGCASHQRPTCPMPQDGVCEAIHHIDARLTTNAEWKLSKESQTDIRWFATNDHEVPR